MEEGARVFPRSSAFEMLLGRVYQELWALQNNPAEFYNRVETFVSVFLPSMFQNKMPPELAQKIEEMEKKVAALEEKKKHIDPLTADDIERVEIPAVKMEAAREILHAAIDVLTDAGFNFPMSKVPEIRRMRP